MSINFEETKGGGFSMCVCCFFWRPDTLRICQLDERRDESRYVAVVPHLKIQKRFLQGIREE